MKKLVQNQKIFYITIFATFFIISLLIYFPIFDIGPYADDDYALISRAKNISNTIWLPRAGYAWRPLEELVAAISINYGFFLHKIFSLLFASLTSVLLIYLANTYLCINHLKSFIIGICFIISPILIFSLFQIDTLSQIMASFSMVLLLVLIFYGIDNEYLKFSNINKLLFYLFYICITVFTILTKEVTFGFVLLSPICVSLILKKDNFNYSNIISLIKENKEIYLINFISIIFVLATKFIVIGNTASGPIGENSTRYTIEFSLLNISRNFILTVFGLIFPGNTANIATLKVDYILVISIIWLICFSFAVIAKSINYIWKNFTKFSQNQSKTVTKLSIQTLGLGIIFISSLFPHALIKVSELYLSSSLPFFLLLIFFILFRLLNLKVKQYIFLLFLASYIFLSLVSIHQKIRLATITYEMSSQLFTENLSGKNSVSCKSLDFNNHNREKFYSQFIIPKSELYRTVVEVTKKEDICSELLKNLPRQRFDRTKF